MGQNEKSQNYLNYHSAAAHHQSLCTKATGRKTERLRDEIEKQK
jgi:hypothetical protein